MKLNKIFIITAFLFFFAGCTSDIYFLNNYKSQEIVTNAQQLEGNLDPTKVYVIDGIIDMGNTSIIVPPQGLSIVSSSGGSFGISGFSSSAKDYTLFTYEQSNYSGDLFLSGGLEITLTGNNSTIFDLNNKENFGAFEFQEVNFNQCTNIGEIKAYRQILGQNVAVFGCEDGFTFSGFWAGGVRIDTLLLRNFNGTFFKQGDNLTFTSRFFTDLNADFQDAGVLADFNESNFLNDLTFQLRSATITRNGDIIDNDSSYLPFIGRSSVKSSFRNNIGIGDTFEGGLMTWSDDQTTSLIFNVSSKGAGNTTYSDLQHFSFDGNNSIQYIASFGQSFEINGQIVIANGAGDQVEVIVRKYINSTGLYEDVRSIERKIINNAGNYDVAIYDIYSIVNMAQYDKIEIWVKNKTDGSDAIIVKDSFLTIGER